MIALKTYNKQFEETYLKCVEKKIDEKVRKQLAESSRNYLPPGFFKNTGEAAFAELVLAPYEKLAAAQQYIEKKTLAKMEQECREKNSAGKQGEDLKEIYKKLYEAYERVSKSRKNGKSMNVRMVEALEITVCPYCNRDYINSRGDTASGAQMDHFFPRADYPVFSVCLYNLVPSCGNCNRIKSEKAGPFASPFDRKIDWDNNIKFSYKLIDAEEKEITIEAEESVKNNIQKMKIDKAYLIHSLEAKELIEKKEAYSKTQLKEFSDVLESVKMPEEKMKEIIFGPQITEERMRKIPLGRLMRDLQRELGIYE